MPGAGRTHGPPATKQAGGSHHRQGRSNRHSLRDGLRLIARSPRCTGLCSHRRQKRNWFRSRLDPSVGRSGPHAFAVREAAFVGAHKRAQHPHGHRIPPPTSVTIASRPSRGSRMRGEKHEFRKNGRGIFLRWGLDRVMGLRWLGKIGVLARTGPDPAFAYQTAEPRAEARSWRAKAQ